MGLLNSSHCSIIFRNMNIWSVHPLPFLNPACCSRNSWSHVSLSLLYITLQRVFPGTDRREMPRQLLQLLRSPFLGTVTIMLFLQSLGTHSDCHILLYMEVNFSIPKSPRALSISAVIRSSPGLLFNFCIDNASFTSSTRRDVARIFPRGGRNYFLDNYPKIQNLSVKL